MIILQEECEYIKRLGRKIMTMVKSLENVYYSETLWALIS